MFKFFFASFFIFYLLLFFFVGCNIDWGLLQVTHADFKKAKEKVMFKKKEGVPEGLYMW